MRPYLIIFLVLFSLQWTQAQQDSKNAETGEILIIGSYDGMDYDHLHFPKLNFILKRGGIGNWSNLRGTKVVVKEKYQNSSGETFAILEPADGRRFFKVFSSVTASYEQALANGELKRL